MFTATEALPSLIMQRLIDLNCDLGEGVGNESLIMPYISSANIACGFHAGDESLMEATAELCLKHGVAIGAHPSFPDRKNFGRTRMDVSPESLFEMIAQQILTLGQICSRLGTRLHHVKPHGALYNMAAEDIVLARVITDSVKKIDSSLIFYGLSGSQMAKAAEEAGLRFFNEVFADRTYCKNGTLTPRSDPNALISDSEIAAEQAAKFAIGEGVIAEGIHLNLKADTICIHGDGSDAVGFALTIQRRFQELNIQIGVR